MFLTNYRHFSQGNNKKHNREYFEYYQDAVRIMFPALNNVFLILGAKHDKIYGNGRSDRRMLVRVRGYSTLIST